MQDIHSIGAGRTFLTGDRRLKHHYHQPALKCPRCDSLNTKFCYYNNYNLSQPRHFCKNCRRYWTKGGVLRNVPIGGGCRKSKRSKPKIEKPNLNSTSENSSITAATTVGVTNVVHEIVEPSKLLDPQPLDQNQGTMDGQIFSNEMMGLVGTTGGINDDGLAAVIDWGGSNGGDLGLFDLTAAVDLAYWSNPSQWTDNNDQSLNFLPNNST